MLHEELEKQEKDMVQILLEEPKKHKQRLRQEHEAKRKSDIYFDSAKKILEEYEDKDGLRKAALAEISGENVFSSYYEKLKDIRSHHSRLSYTHPSLLHAAAGMEEGEEGAGDGVPERIESAFDHIQFTGEECHGKYLDMHSLYESFVNLPQIKAKAVESGEEDGAEMKPVMDYMSYLARFQEFWEISKNQKLEGLEGKQYQAYLTSLEEYLIDFYRRVFPLSPLDQMLQLIDDDFKTRWENGSFPEWADDEQAKSELEADPLFCQACQKLFSKQTVFDNHTKGKKHKKAMKLLAAGAANVAANAKRRVLSRMVALKEERITNLAALLDEVIESTRDFIEKKQTWTGDERAAMLDSDDEISDDDEDSDDEKFVNYKNVPLGWDGKPIPYWLYKLHGLNLSKTCEICGNYSYRGPRAFEKHFLESRHAYGMKCLGIPMTKHFINVTQIEDAMSLWEKVKAESVKKDFNADDQEEFEDSEGNVYNKKTYEDLKRQGLI